MPHRSRITDYTANASIQGLLGFYQPSLQIVKIRVAFSKQLFLQVQKQVATRSRGVTYYGTGFKTSFPYYASLIRATVVDGYDIVMAILYLRYWQRVCLRVL
jgi:hypothetical protein